MLQAEINITDWIQSRLLLGSRLGTITPPPWLVDSISRYRRDVLDPAYPCYLGSITEARGDMMYTFVEDRRLDDLPDALRTFLTISEDNRARRHALAAFFQPEPADRTHEEYGSLFWETLQYLHEHDSSDWPGSVAPDPEDPTWEFSYHGVAMFIFAASPSYRNRRSRNLGPSLILLFQPRSVFDGMEGGTPNGRRIRDRIRNALRLWNGMEPHPALGAYGDPANREWQQYFLPDTNEPVTGGCPFRFLFNRRSPG